MKRTVAMMVVVMAAQGCAGTGDGGSSSSGGSNNATGRVQVFVEAEDTIPDGLTPGTGEENILDGWTVTYDKFLVTVGDVKASRSSSTPELTDPRTFVVDLKALPTSGVVIADFQGVAAERWSRFGFSLPKASSSSLMASGLDHADHTLMVDHGYALYVEGTMTNPQGQRCVAGQACEPATTIHFTFFLDKGTAFSDCAPPQGDSGFSVTSGGTVQVKPTIHGDHWFFTNITQGAETTDRRAQWIADSDVNRDGQVTMEELATVQASDVFPASQYNLSGSIIPVVTARDYVLAQAHTLGDFQGEGECPTRQILE